MREVLQLLICEFRHGVQRHLVRLAPDESEREQVPACDHLMPVARKELDPLDLSMDLIQQKTASLLEHPSCTPGGCN